MDAPVVELAGVALRAPVTAGTNLLVAVQCWVYQRGLGRGHRRARLWAPFFLLMAAATAVGAVKHGQARHRDGALAAAVLLASNLAAGAAVYAAQWAALAWRPARERYRLEALFRVQLVAFVTLALARRDFLPVLLQSVAGLGWVLGTATTAARRGRPGARAVALGMAVALASGVVYAAGLAPHRWFTHVDLAHVLMAAGLAFVHRGAR